MAVLISTKVVGQTTAGYDSVLAAVSDAIRQAPGFIFHAAHPETEEWQVYEVWESKAAADRWFADFVVPNLPKGVRPKRNYTELHAYLAPTIPAAEQS